MKSRKSTKEINKRSKIKESKENRTAKYGPEKGPWEREDPPPGANLRATGLNPGFDSHESTRSYQTRSLVGVGICCGLRQ